MVARIRAKPTIICRRVKVRFKICKLSTGGAWTMSEFEKKIPSVKWCVKSSFIRLDVALAQQVPRCVVLYKTVSDDPDFIWYPAPIIWESYRFNLLVFPTAHDKVCFVNDRNLFYARLDYKPVDEMWINVEGSYLRLRISIASCTVVFASPGRLFQRIVSAARNFSNASPAKQRASSHSCVLCLGLPSFLPLPTLRFRYASKLEI